MCDQNFKIVRILFDDFPLYTAWMPHVIAQRQFAEVPDQPHPDLCHGVIRTDMGTQKRHAIHAKSHSHIKYRLLSEPRKF